MIGNDVAVAGMLIVPVAVFDRFPRLSPILEAFSPAPNVGDQSRDGAVWRDLRKADFDQAFDVTAYECLGLHCRPEFCRVHCCAIMTHTRCLLREVSGKRRISRSDNRPAVNEDLCADL